MKEQGSHEMCGESLHRRSSFGGHPEILQEQSKPVQRGAIRLFVCCLRKIYLIDVDSIVALDLELDDSVLHELGISRADHFITLEDTDCAVLSF